jgi:hypothetical protein
LECGNERLLLAGQRHLPFRYERLPRIVVRPFSAEARLTLTDPEADIVRMLDENR